MNKLLALLGAVGFVFITAIFLQEGNNSLDSYACYRPLKNSVEVIQCDAKPPYKDISGNTIYPTETYSVSVDISGLPENCKGWIHLPNSSISYPVMQCADNAYYKTYDCYNSKNAYGAIYLDCNNSADDKTLIIYGNSPLGNYSMFSELEKVRTDYFYDEYSTFYLNFGKGHLDLKPYTVIGYLYFYDEVQSFKPEDFVNKVMTEGILFEERKLSDDKQHICLVAFENGLAADSTLFVVLEAVE